MDWATAESLAFGTLLLEAVPPLRQALALLPRQRDVYLDLATALVGRFRGGLAYVNVVDSMFFGGISGSAVADVSALGTFLIPQMVRKGYDRDFATILTICTAILAPIIPPSIPNGSPPAGGRWPSRSSAATW